MENIIADNKTYKQCTIYEELIENNNASILQKRVNLLMASWIDAVGGFSYEMSETECGIKIKTGTDAENYISYGTFKEGEAQVNFYPTPRLNYVYTSFESFNIAYRPAFTWIFKENMFFLQYSYDNVANFLILAKDVNGESLILGINNLNGIMLKSDTAYEGISMMGTKQIAKERICLIPFYDIKGGKIDGLYECVADDRSSKISSRIYKDSTGRKWWLSAIYNFAPYVHLFKGQCNTVFAVQVQ